MQRISPKASVRIENSLAFWRFQELFLAKKGSFNVKWSKGILFRFPFTDSWKKCKEGHTHMKTSLNLFVCEQWQKGFTTYTAISRYCVKKLFFGEKVLQIHEGCKQVKFDKCRKRRRFFSLCTCIQMNTLYVYLWPLSILSGGTSMSQSYKL